MTTGFGPFELRPVDYYREGGTTPHLRLVYLRSPALRWLSKYTVAKQNGGGAEWVELFITPTKGGRTNVRTLAVSRPGVRGLFSASCIEGSSLDARGCSAATLSR